MIPIYLSLMFLIFISIKNLKSAYHIDKIILVGSLTAIFGIVSTAVGISNAWSIAPNISNIAPYILLNGLKTSMVTTFAGGLVLLFSTHLDGTPAAAVSDDESSSPSLAEQSMISNRNELFV